MHSATQLARHPAGLTAENVAEKYHVEREAQDRFAAASHAKAAAAQVGGLEAKGAEGAEDAR